MTLLHLLLPIVSLQLEENINYIAQQIKATYLNEVSGGFRYQGATLGFKTTDMNNKRIDANSEGMNFYYASDINWGQGIARHMQNILPYDQAYYSNATADKSVYQHLQFHKEVIFSHPEYKL